MKNFVFWILCAGVAAICVWWSSTLIYKTYTENGVRKYILKSREKNAVAKDEKNGSEVTIGVAMSNVETDKNSRAVVNGIRVAAEMINSSGGMRGHKVKLIVKDDNKNISDAMIVAQELSNNADITAVIGHRSSVICDSVNVMYEYYGLPNITPRASAALLTGKGFKYNARACLSDEFIALKMAALLERKKWKKAVFFNIQDIFGKGFRNSVESVKGNYDFTIEASVGFDKNISSETIKAQLQWLNNNFAYDVIIVIGHTSQIKEYIGCIRQSGIRQPILTIDSLSNSAIESLGFNVDNTYIISEFAGDMNNPIFKQLSEVYTEKYKSDVTAYVVNGFNSLYTLKLAVEKAGTLRPKELMDALRGLSGVDANGEFKCDSNGDRECAVTVRYIDKGGNLSVVDKF